MSQDPSESARSFKLRERIFMMVMVFSLVVVSGFLLFVLKSAMNVPATPPARASQPGIQAPNQSGTTDPVVPHRLQTP